MLSSSLEYQVTKTKSSTWSDCSYMSLGHHNNCVLVIVSEYITFYFKIQTWKNDFTFTDFVTRIWHECIVMCIQNAFILPRQQWFLEVLIVLSFLKFSIPLFLLFVILFLRTLKLSLYKVYLFELIKSLINHF